MTSLAFVWAETPKPAEPKSAVKEPAAKAAGSIVDADEAKHIDVVFGTGAGAESCRLSDINVEQHVDFERVCINYFYSDCSSNMSTREFIVCPSYFKNY